MSEAMQPGPLTESDISVLEEFLIYIAVQFVVHGIYSALVIIVLYKRWTNKAKLAANHILITAVIGTFVSNTITTFQVLAHYLVELPILGFDPPNVKQPLIYMGVCSEITS
ncbi:hypothetical protein C8J56DRAFT_1046751 [Mycena floridula]|nr:hypothetical protein C8J56DRAFT_1046751 [Mycena floridula]